MATFLPDAGNVIIENVKEHDGTIVVQARSCQTKVVCPKCGGVARRVHSRYARHVKDITWLGHSSRLVLVMRKFFATWMSACCRFSPNNCVLSARGY